MTPATLTLTDFLLARLAEDEAAAKRAIGASAAQWQAQSDVVVWGDEWAVAPASLPTAAHIARHDPARVLADVEAKRAIVELHTGSHECSTFDENGQIDDCTWISGDEWCSTVNLLAAVYASHPDYDEAWRP